MQNSLIRIRPRVNTLYASQGRTVLAMDREGNLDGGREHGLFVHETRMLSQYRWLVEDLPPTPVTLSNVEQHSWLGFYLTLPPGVDTLPPDEGSGQVDLASEQTLELRLSRTVGEGMHEDVDLTNYSLQPTVFRLMLEVEADFADQAETVSGRKQTGQLHREWRQVEGPVWELRLEYRAEHDYHHQGNQGTARLHRCLVLRLENCSSAPEIRDGNIQFQVRLSAQETWHTCVIATPWVDGEVLKPLYHCYSLAGVHSIYDERRNQFLDEATGFRSAESGTLAPVVLAAAQQARQDVAALRLYDLDHEDRAWTMAAGLPIYVALFGRDTLTASWQAALLGPEMMQGSLAELARWQGTEVNDWRDEQPGKMLHEAHTGPLEVLNYNPRSRYYGSITTSGFYPFVVSSLWHWIGDKETARSLVEPMLKALKWLDEYADFDRDGFYEYRTRSEQGSKHQAWKDSRDAIVDADGRPVEPPIAASEEQGFTYVAKLHAAELLWWLGRKDESKALYRQAGELKKRFQEAFWMPEAGFLAMGLDAHKRQIDSIGSNAGHCVAAAIVDKDLVRPVVDRLFQDDLFSGWGIRTLSTLNPAYNPYSYHRGSVWPVEQGTFAMGFYRYGLHAEVQKISRAQFEAAALFEHHRLPELFAGQPRDAEHPFPALYLRANSPQAWSASAVFCFLQAMLGLYPYAPLNLLIVDPHLPDWLPDITLENLRIGRAVVTIRFFRTRNGSSDYRVLERRGPLKVVRQPSPWSITTGWGERTMDILLSV